METHRLALTAGYRLEHYQIERILGKGGFGITYVAIDTHLGKRVAIKELLPDSIATRVEGSTVVPQTTSMEDSWAWAKERFLEEARFLAGFSHPAIVGVHRLLEANGTAYMVMDYVEGESYEARLRRIGKEADQASLMAVMGPIMEGIEELHAKNLLHRDIKPDNILIDKRGKPVLIDFGSARTSVGATMTMTSMVTHGYSPIEQYQTKGKMGPWTDIYALGAVMCRAITGEKPPVAADRVIEDDFEWVSNRKPVGYDETFLNAVDWALRVRVEDRPQNISAFAQHIRHTPTPSSPPPVPTPPPVEVEPAPFVSNPIPKKEKNNNLKGFLILAIAVSVPLFYFSRAFSNNESKATVDDTKKSEYEDLRKNAEKQLAELNLRIAEREKALQQPAATPFPTAQPTRSPVASKIKNANFATINFQKIIDKNPRLKSVINHSKEIGIKEDEKKIRDSKAAVEIKKFMAEVYPLLEMIAYKNGIDVILDSSGFSMGQIPIVIESLFPDYTYELEIKIRESNL
jgi:serine/threonine protein kinase